MGAGFKEVELLPPLLSDTVGGLPAGGLMVKLRLAVPVTPALVADKEMLEDPDPDGVPEIKPLLSIDSPAGRGLAP